MSTNGLLQVTDKFLKQNSKHAKTKKPVKNGGPYTKSEKDKRRDEVYRLHFEYSYSARKIAELMKVNRNTVNGDIDYWYYGILKKVDFIDPEYHVITTLESMQIQLTRLREQLDKAKSISERISIERLIYDINSKIVYTWQKLSDSATRNHIRATKWYNNTLEANDKTERRVSFYDIFTVSKKAHMKIYAIINEDRKRRH